ncbi:MAG: pyridoxamine 5'-phosphate oxidase family protein [Spirochaetales bacterium]|nr:pyridoxamine 5'-phosphate oxidase family protein [Spirochaetales bacterium]
MITEAMQAGMQGVIPSIIVTCDTAGVPNATVISQVYYVDETHVAISNQFFSKTHKNLAVNPLAAIQIVDPGNATPYLLEARYIRTETSGEVFENMAMQLEVIASMSGMSDVFKLSACEILEVTSVAKLDAFG